MSDALSKARAKQEEMYGFAYQRSLQDITIYRGMSSIPTLKPGEGVMAQCPECRTAMILTANPFLNCSRCGTRMIYMLPGPPR